MPSESVAIIGAGLAGLATGCYAQMNGFRSHVFEHHSVSGGVAAAWTRKGYHIDGGIHFLMAYRPGTSIHEMYGELGALDGVHVSPLATYGRYIDQAGGLDLVLGADLDRFRADLVALSPPDAPLVDGLVDGARAMRGMDMGASGMEKPPELTTSLDRVVQMWKMRKVARYFTGRYRRSMAGLAAEFRHPGLRGLVSRLFLPEVPVWFVQSLLALLADGQLGLLTGGCREFVEAIERRYLALGGEISHRSTVDEILVSDHRATGVRLTDGGRHEADCVVSAADGYGTVYHMLGGRYLDEATRLRYERWPLFKPWVIVSLGVALEFPSEPSFVTIVLPEPLVVGDAKVDTLVVRFLNYGRAFAPPGRTVVQIEFESTWEHWADLHDQDAAAYRAEKERVAAEALRLVGPYYPGLAAAVEMTDVATPYTTWRYTLNRHGAYEGWLPTDQAIMTPVRRTLPGLAAFYMAGQWVVPGGGVPPCLFSGRHAVQLLCRDLGRPFRAARS
jgi:phytoene desaturase